MAALDPHLGGGRPRLRPPLPNPDRRRPRPPTWPHLDRRAPEPPAHRPRTDRLLLLLPLGLPYPPQPGLGGAPATRGLRVAAPAAAAENATPTRGRGTLPTPTATAYPAARPPHPGESDSPGSGEIRGQPLQPAIERHRADPGGSRFGPTREQYVPGKLSRLGDSGAGLSRHRARSGGQLHLGRSRRHGVAPFSIKPPGISGSPSTARWSPWL